MLRQSLQSYGSARHLASVLSAAILAIGLCSCQTDGEPDITGSLGEKAEASPAADPRREVDLYGERFRANAADAEAALQYAKALRATGRRAQAVAVLEQATLARPDNKALLAEYGGRWRITAISSRPSTCSAAPTAPTIPIGGILSVQGAVLDQLGRNEEARQYYASALKIAPDEPSVLSNLGLSYMLSKDLPKAEETLRHASGRAGASPRVRQNLALVVGLQDRLAEAETIVKADQPAGEAEANVTFLKGLLSRKDGARAEADGAKATAR